MLRQARVYLEMIKFSHTLFALPFALLATALAVHRLPTFRPLDLLGVVACMVFARSAAMGFNRWADWAVDALNPRTAERAIPTGRLSAGQVLRFVLISSVGFIAATGLFCWSSGNVWPLLFSAPLLVFLFAYSYAKRFTIYAHVWLGAALAASPLAVWIALLPPGDWLPPLFLGLAIIGWVVGFDVIYACQDIDVDRALGLFSIPARIGFARALGVARAAHLAMAASLAALGWATPELGRWYWLGFAGAVGLLIAEHWLVRGRNLAKINLAFFQVNGIISVGLLVAALLDLYLG